MDEAASVGAMASVVPTDATADLQVLRGRLDDLQAPLYGLLGHPCHGHDRVRNSSED
jgi:hypothetical protein